MTSCSRFVQCQCCGRVYRLPVAGDDLQAVLTALRGVADPTSCYATRKLTFTGDLPCESQVFREIPVEVVALCRETALPVIPKWYRADFSRLIVTYQQAGEQASIEPHV